MSLAVLLEVLLGALLTVSAIVTVAVLWPGGPPPPRPPSFLDPPPACRPPVTGGRLRPAADRCRRGGRRPAPRGGRRPRRVRGGAGSRPGS
ncbi:hypothetical protein PS9374_00682 [Planomonospora sphaerica]|uniref:Uncharacterized protein n=1 Tax=Planomonospora sphaerica TaxID=161355 RepID=A0A171BGA5_9ACTN|nr:hypothetical protein [Planomonospora sphaerica]GAT65050.1 hypothetical protein PS9374_00682 [Planomonospora sphaerica]